MLKIKLMSLFLATILMLPTLFACQNNAKPSEDKVTTNKTEIDYEMPTTDVRPSEDGSTVVEYALNIPNSGKITGSKMQTLKDGRTTAEVRVTASVGYEFKGWSDGVYSPNRSGDSGKEGRITTYYAILAPVALEMPIISITTETGHDVTSKDDYINGTVTISNCDEKYAAQELEMMIRGRGNFSWNFEKKSYRIKFNEKVNVLGIGEKANKSWNLISNHCDQSLLRNYTALKFASMMPSIAYSPACTSVEVYVNGAYNGVYLLCEAIQAKNGRVDINRDIETGTDIGYLVQMTNYAESPMFTVGDKNYEIKSDLSVNSVLAQGQTKYINDYISKCYEAVISGDKAKIEELIDLESMIDTYIVEELVKNLDVGWDSFYIYKDKGSKLCFGPIWDFDLSLGNADEGCQNYTDLHAAQNTMRQSNPWYAIMMTHGWFRTMVSERYHSQEVQEIIFSLPILIRNEVENNYNSLCRNFDRWKIFGHKLNREPQEIVSLTDYDQHYKYLISWLEARIDFMNNFIGGERYNAGYNTSSGGTSVLPPPSVEFSGGGTGKQEDPYVIANASDFALFTELLLSGTSFKNVYFKQSANIDMSTVSSYAGAGSTATFAGIYDGGVYTITANLSGKDQCIFPYVSGIILNLGTTGSVNNTNQASGICRSVRKGAVIINCYSLMSLTSGTGQSGGIAASTESGDLYILNCYFAGSITGSGGPICVWRSDRSGYFEYLYSASDLGADTLSSADILLTGDQMNEYLANTLSQNVELIKNKYQIDTSDLLDWTVGESTPVLAIK